MMRASCRREAPKTNIGSASSESAFRLAFPASSVFNRFAVITDFYGTKCGENVVRIQRAGIPDEPRLANSSNTRGAVFVLINIGLEAKSHDGGRSRRRKKKD